MDSSIRKRFENLGLVDKPVDPNNITLTNDGYKLGLKYNGSKPRLFDGEDNHIGYVSSMRSINQREDINSTLSGAPESVLRGTQLRCECTFTVDPKTADNLLRLRKHCYLEDIEDEHGNRSMKDLGIIESLHNEVNALTGSFVMTGVFRSVEESLPTEVMVDIPGNGSSTSTNLPYNITGVPILNNLPNCFVTGAPISTPNDLHDLITGAPHSGENIGAEEIVREEISEDEIIGVEYPSTEEQPEVVNSPEFREAATTGIEPSFASINIRSPRREADNDPEGPQDDDLSGMTREELRDYALNLREETQQLRAESESRTTRPADGQQQDEPVENDSLMRSALMTTGIPLWLGNTDAVIRNSLDDEGEIRRMLNEIIAISARVDGTLERSAIEARIMQYAQELSISTPMTLTEVLRIVRNRITRGFGTYSNNPEGTNVNIISIIDVLELRNISSDDSLTRIAEEYNASRHLSENSDQFRSRLINIIHNNPNRRGQPLRGRTANITVIDDVGFGDVATNEERERLISAIHNAPVTNDAAPIEENDTINNLRYAVRNALDHYVGETNSETLSTEITNTLNEVDEVGQIIPNHIADEIISHALNNEIINTLDEVNDEVGQIIPDQNGDSAVIPDNTTFTDANGNPISSVDIGIDIDIAPENDMMDSIRLAVTNAVNLYVGEINSEELSEELSREISDALENIDEDGETVPQYIDDIVAHTVDMNGNSMIIPDDTTFTDANGNPVSHVGIDVSDGNDNTAITFGVGEENNNDHPSWNGNPCAEIPLNGTSQMGADLRTIFERINSITPNEPVILNESSPSEQSEGRTVRQPGNGDPVTIESRNRGDRIPYIVDYTGIMISDDNIAPAISESRTFPLVKKY